MSAHIAHVWMQPATSLLCFALLPWITEAPPILWPSKAQLLVQDSSSMDPNQPKGDKKETNGIRAEPLFFCWRIFLFCGLHSG